MQNPKENSTSKKSPSSSPDQRPPTDKPEVVASTQNTASAAAAEAGTGKGEKGRRFFKKTLRIPKKALRMTCGEGGSSDTMEASMGDNFNLVEVPVQQVPIGVGGSSAAALEVAVAVEDPSGRSSSGRRVKLKRKPSSAPEEPSDERPACRVCLEKFATWKIMFEHMQASHPNRNQHLHPPPIDPASSPTRQEVHDQPADQGKGGDSGTETGAGGRGFDLNQPMEGVELGAEKKEEEKETKISGAAERNDGGERKINRFDLNELPEVDEDEDKP